MVDYESVIRELEKGDGLSDTKLDSLRVLAEKFGKRWKSDLLRDLNLFRKIIGRRGEVRSDDFDNALRELERDGLVDTEDRPKATGEGPKPDTLISLTDLNGIRKALADDEVLREYRRKSGLGSND